MKPLNSIFIICSLLSLGSCSTQDKASQQLEAYLREMHTLEVNDSTFYCFFPANQCKNCFLYNASYLSPEANAHTMIITGFDSSNFKGFRHVLHDPENAMLGLRTLDYGNRIVTFENGRISGVAVVRDLYAQLDSAWLQLNDKP